MKPHILLIDDSEAVRAAIASVLSHDEYFLTTAATGAEGLTAIEHQKFDLVLLDYALPDTDGISVLHAIIKKKPDLPVIMVTGSGSERIAVNALKSGASDYVVKSSDFIAKLPHVVQDNLEKHEMKRRNRELESQLRESYKQLKHLNKELEQKVQARTEELERAYQLSNELIAKAVDSNMQLAELYSEVDEARRKLDEKLRQMALLNDIGRVMASTLDHDTLLQAALEAINQQFNVTHAAIALIDGQTGRLRIGVSRGTPDDLLLAAKSLDGGDLLWKIIRKNTPLLVQDAETHPQLRLLARDFPGLDSLMLIPLCVNEVEFGILTLYGFENRSTFTTGDLEFASSLAHQTALGMTKIRLMNQRLQEDRMEMLEQIMQGLAQTLAAPLRELRQTAVEMSQNGRASTPNLLREIDDVSDATQELVEYFAGRPAFPKLHTLTVQEFVETFIAAIQPAFARRQINIRTVLHYPAQFTVDILKMRRVFGHIAANARDAMPSGGTFALTARLIDGMVQFELTDDGCGMSPDMQARLFEPFVSEWTPPRAGLGLTLARQIVVAHHGAIDVRSMVGQGTTVRILLPGLPQHVWEQRAAVEAMREEN